MDRISSFNHYKQLVREAKDRLGNGNTDTNCFLMSREINSLIDEHRLLYLSYSDGLIVLVDEVQFYELYYFWSHSAPFCRLHLDKDASVVEMNNDGRRNAYIDRIEAKLSDNGFRYLKTSRLWTMDIDSSWPAVEKGYRNSLSTLNQTNLRLLTPIPCEYAKAAVTLWEQELDTTDIPDSHKNFLQHPEDRTACIVDDNGQIASAYWWHVGQMSSEGRHIVTHPGYTRRGLGSLLLFTCVKDLYSAGIPRLTTYISDSNDKSILLHKKVGFQPTEKISRQYILKGR